MAGNEETEQPLNSDEEKTNAAADKGERIVKKAAKKRAAKKKVVKKRVAAKKKVTKKTAAPVASSTNRAIAQETAQGAAEAAITEERSTAVDHVTDDEPPEAGQRGVKKEIPVAAEPSELPREEKVSMPVDASKAAKSSAVGGFWPKVILWVVVVLASFMYIRSLAHKGQTVKRVESPVPAALSLTAEETSTNSLVENRASASAAIGQSAENGLSPVAKVAEVAIEKETESSSEVSVVVPTQTASGAEQATAPTVRQAVVETATAMEKEASQAATSTLLSTAASDPANEPVAAAEGSGLVQSADSASVPADDQAAVNSVSAGSDSQSDSIDKSSEIAVVGEQKTAPSAAVIESSAGDEEKRGAAGQAQSQQRPEIAAIPEDSVASAPARQSIENSGTAGSTDTAASSSVVAQPMHGRESTSNTRRPTFKELFGYERPKPPVRRRNLAMQEAFSRDGFEQRGMYPAPWPHAPVQPAWGEYPGQYGPYGNFGGYPSYPNMPEWAPYQPYGYGPSGY